MEIIDVELGIVKEGDNPRQDYGTDVDELNLGNSLLKRQDYPILIRVHPTLSGFFQIVDGHRRARAARRVLLKTLKAMVVAGELTEAEIRLIMLRTDLHKKKLSEWERYRLVKEIEAAHPGITRKALGELVELNGPVITQILTEGVAEVEEAFREGRIGLAKRYELAKKTPEQQSAQLAAALAGASRAELANGGGKPKRKPTDADTKKTDSVKIVLGGVTITLKGEGLNLTTVARLLMDAGREANAGVKEGQAASTFARLMADRARKAAEAKAAEAQAAGS